MATKMKNVLTEAGNEILFEINNVAIETKSVAIFVPRDIKNSVDEKRSENIFTRSINSNIVGEEHLTACILVNPIEVSKIIFSSTKDMDIMIVEACYGDNDGNKMCHPINFIQNPEQSNSKMLVANFKRGELKLNGNNYIKVFVDGNSRLRMAIYPFDIQNKKPVTPGSKRKK